MLRDGQTLQDAVKAYERPSPEFYAGMQIPPRIPKPELANGLGVSNLQGTAWVDIDPKFLIEAQNKSRLRRP